MQIMKTIVIHGVALRCCASAIAQSSWMMTSPLTTCLAQGLARRVITTCPSLAHAHERMHRWYDAGAQVLECNQVMEQKGETPGRPDGLHSERQLGCANGATLPRNLPSISPSPRADLSRNNQAQETQHVACRGHIRTRPRRWLGCARPCRPASGPAAGKAGPGAKSRACGPARTSSRAQR